jgi:O-antigen/teichoic acid export membrane protein
VTAHERPFRRQVLVNTLSTGAGNVWAMIVAIVAVPLLLDGLGSTAFGTWALLLTFSAVNGWFSLMDLGIGVAATRAIAAHASTADHHAGSQVASSALATLAVVSLGSAFVFATVGRWVLPTLFRTPESLVADLQFAIVAFAGTIVFDLVTEGCQACLEGLQRVDLSRLCDALRRTAFAVATAAAALAGGGLRGVASAGLAASVLGTLVSYVLLRRRLAVALPRPAAREVRSLLSYGKTIAVLRPLGVIERSMNRIIVGVVFGPAAVTPVEIATQVSNGADAILSASAYAVVPTSSWLHAREDETTMRELVVRGTKYSVLMTAFVVAVVAVLAQPIVDLWIGPEADGAAGLAVVALLSILMVAPIAVGSNLLLGTGRAPTILRAASAAIVVNLAASLALVHLVGLVGAFQATLVANAVMIPILGRAFLAQSGLTARAFIRQSVLPTAAPTAVTVALLVPLVLAGLSDAVTVVVGTVIGSAAFWLTAARWSFARGEVRELVGSIRRPREIQEP